MAVPEELEVKVLASSILAGFQSRLREIQRVRDTCDICNAYQSPCNEVIHAAYDEMREEELEDEIAANAAARARGETISFISADDFFDSLGDLGAQIEQENRTMPLGHLLAETLDFISEGCITHIRRGKSYVEGRTRRKTFTYVCCPVCTAEVTLEDYENDVELPHDAYCIVPQSRILKERLLAASKAEL